jgi:hypothetical protein
VPHRCTPGARRDRRVRRHRRHGEAWRATRWPSVPIESCGKCTPCRIGSTRGVEVIDRIVADVDRRQNLERARTTCARPWCTARLCGHRWHDAVPRAESALQALPGRLHAERESLTCNCHRYAQGPGDAGEHGPDAGHGPDRWRGRQQCRRAPRVMRAAALGAGVTDPQAVRHRHRSRPSARAVCASSRSKDASGYPASCTTEVARRHAGPHAVADTLSRLRKGNVMELYVSDHPLDCDGCPADRPLRAAGPWPRSSACSAGALWNPGDATARGKSFRPADTSQSVFQVSTRISSASSATRCVRACDEHAGNPGAHDRWTRLWFQSKVAASENDSFLDSECVSCGACVEACPTASIDREIRHRLRSAEPTRSVTTTCAYCGVGCSLVHAEVKDDDGCAHGAESRGPGEPRPCLRQGPVRLGLCHPCGPHHVPADDPSPKIK